MAVAGFRRCHAPYCRVSRTRTVWPREYRIATGWGLVHLACRPSPRQAAMLRMMAAMRLAANGLGPLAPVIRRATRQMQHAIQTGLLPPDQRPPELWEHMDAHRVTFED